MRLVALILLAACGGSPLTARAFPAAFAQAVCEVRSRCNQEAAYLEKACEDDAASLYGTDLARAIAAGKSKFDAAQAQLCVDGLRARGCGRTPPEVDQACERAVIGTIPSGQPCNWIYECASGRCEPESAGACPATCHDIGGLGAPCTNGCDLRAALRCIDNVCSTLHGAGEKCSSDSDCSMALYCDGFGKCSARASEQASCESDQACAAGLWCDLAADGGLCRSKIALGQSCSARGADAIRTACVDGAVCKGFNFTKTGATPGVCTATGEIGASCVGPAQVTGCGDGLVCVNGTCADKPVSGPCTDDQGCKEGAAYCDGAQCQTLKAEGATCTRTPECATHFCEPSTAKCVAQEVSCHEH